MAEQSEQWRGVPAGVPCWHIHHRTLLEWSVEPLEQRANYIKERKPRSEVSTRLQLLAPVKGELPAVVMQMGERVLLTRDLLIKWGTREAEENYVAADTKFHQALSDHSAEINALHRKECPNCPWNGKTIFPEENPDG